MKFKRSDFLAAPESSIHVSLDYADPTGERFVNTPVKAVPSCRIEGILHFDGRSRVVSSLHYTGIMTVEDSITGEDLDVDFETDSQKEYSFDPLEEDDDEEEIIRVFKDILDLTDEAEEAIAYEAPMSITHLAREEYPQGEGWSLISDQDAVPDTQEEDPRWAKLKEFKFED
ncbi:MAG: YceD family protein [Allobaculum sp.]